MNNSKLWKGVLWWTLGPVAIFMGCYAALGLVGESALMNKEQMAMLAFTATVVVVMALCIFWPDRYLSELDYRFAKRMRFWALIAFFAGPWLLVGGTWTVLTLGHDLGIDSLPPVYACWDMLGPGLAAACLGGAIVWLVTYGAIGRSSTSYVAYRQPSHLSLAGMTGLTGFGVLDSNDDSNDGTGYSGASYLDETGGIGSNFGGIGLGGDSYDTNPVTGSYMTDGISGIDSGFGGIDLDSDSYDINPATGLCMIGGIGGVDSSGNLYGDD